jgi:GNAT superfamily N-acetyltransferase
MNIKRLTVENMDQMMLIQQDSYEPDLRDPITESEEFFSWPICHGLFINDKLIATIYAYIEEKTLHIYSIECLKDYRRQNLGSKLIEFGITYANSIDVEKIRGYAISDGGLDLLLKFDFQSCGYENILGYEAAIMSRMLDRRGFTLGHTKSYDESLMVEPIVMKTGRNISYEGGWVWSTPQAARDFLYSKQFLNVDWGDNKQRNPDNFSIYVLKINNWSEDISELDSLGNKHLLHDAQIINKFYWNINIVC